MEDKFLERRIKSNFWVIKTRWVHTAAILLVGIGVKAIGDFDFPYFLSISLAGGMALINIIFYFLAKRVKEANSPADARYLSYAQIGVDLIVITAIFYLAGALESAIGLLFFLPITTSIVLYGYLGPIVVAFTSVVMVSTIVGLEFMQVIPHFARYGVVAIEYKFFSIGITKLIVTDAVYMIIGFYAGYISKLLMKREISLSKKNIELKESSDKIKKAFLKLKKLEYRLSLEHTKVAGIIESFIDPIILIDTNNRISLFNPAASNVLGLNARIIDTEISPQNNYSIKNFKFLINEKHTIKTSEELKTGDNIEEIYIQKEDIETAYKITTVQVYDSRKKYLGTMKIFYNLTREKMVDRLKSEFISIAAHQLRTPLSAIKWSIKVVLDGDTGKLNKEQQETLTKGYLSNERIIKLVNDMLDVSRIEEGKFGYNFIQENIEHPLNVAIDSLIEGIKTKKLNVNIDKPDKIPLVYMDKEKMVMVFQNLLENAVEYTPERGKIDITIKERPRWLEISIKDNGVGVPMTDKSKLFSKFFRAANVIRMQTDGSGLGLFIAKNIIKKHGGNIECESEEGVGTEFVFTIPFKRSA